MKNLILFFTKTGFTEDCVNILKDKLKGSTDIVNLNKKVPKSIKDYDTIIIGGGIYVGKISKKQSNFLIANLDTIISKKIGLFITSGDNENTFENRGFPEKLLEKAIVKEHFGGGLNTSKLRLIEKLIMKMIGKYKDYSNINQNAIIKFAEIMNK